MHLNELREIREAELKIDVPQPLPDSFYETVLSELDGDSAGEYETELKRLYQCRVRKIVWSARLAAEGSSTITDNLTPKEAEFHDGLRTFIELEQERLFGPLASIDGRTG